MTLSTNSLILARLSGVDSALALKAPCRCATTGPITLAGFQTIDGVTLLSTDAQNYLNTRVLVNNQLDQTQNGIYNTQPGNWTRAADFDANDDAVQGTRVSVAEGNTQVGVWVLVTADPVLITNTGLGVSNIQFVPAFNTDFVNSGRITTFDLLAPTSTQGDLIYNNGTTNTRLPAGSVGSFLQTGGSGANPSWFAPGAAGSLLESASSGASPVWLAPGTAGSFLRSTGTTSSPGWAQREIVDAKEDFGAAGDGSTDDTTALQNWLNFCFGTSGSPHGGTNPQLNLVAYLPPGNYKITSALTVRSVCGGRIMGAGRLTTTITQATSNTSVLVTNGFEYSIVDGIQFITNGGICVDLDWDNTGSASLQSNTFRDCLFQGNSVSGSIGVRVGHSFMGSENLFLNCFWANCVDGLRVENFNALQNTVVGGDFQGCSAHGIYVAAGSVTLVASTGFQNGTTNTFDIAIYNSSDDTMSIIGCRTESTNFGQFRGPPQLSIIGCSQAASTNGVFVDAGNCPINMDSCSSNMGTVSLQNVRGRISGCSFLRSDAFQPIGQNPGSYNHIEIANTWTAATPDGGGTPTLYNSQRLDSYLSTGFAEFPAYAWISNNANLSVSDSSGANGVFGALFGSGVGYINCEVGAYEFSGELMLTTTGTNSHTWGILLKTNNGLTLSSSGNALHAVAVANATGAIAAPSMGSTSSPVTPFTVTAASTAAQTITAKFGGRINVTTRGNVGVALQLSAATGGTNTLLAGSFFRMRSLSDNTNQFVGNWG